MLEIRSKTDILIPFNRIGDEGWETKTLLIIQAIAANWNRKLPKALSTEEIIELENRLGTTLPEGLKMFYQTFGIADISETLQGLSEIGWIKDIWAGVPQYAPNFTESEQAILPHLVSFSDYLGNGNMFCFHRETKAIYYYDHDSKPYLSKIFDTVDDYIKGCLIFAQSDLFTDVAQEMVDTWTEEIVSEILGANTVKKWRY
ncbi:MAG: SMI1/KNR4 family protein [Fibrobacteres bacterium]|nr:SMI1/KNR4 family protein [Fibrobacterota bacterium]